MANRRFLEYLSHEETADIHCATLQVLEEIGVVFPAPSALQILEDAGCSVDAAAQRVRFPPALVEDAIRQAPSSFGLYGRDGRLHIRLGDGCSHFCPNALAVNVVDLDGHFRPSTLDDVANLARLADALPHVHEGHGSVHPTDLPDGMAHPQAMLAMFRNTTKPFKARGWGRQQALDSIRMSEVVAGGSDRLRMRPIIMRNINSVSPLAHGKELLEGALEFVGRGLPVIMTPEIQFGGTGPITLAGALVQQNAEILSFFTLAQVVRPGTPLVYGTVSSSMDMRRGSLPYATVEACLFNVLTAQMARFYGVPSRGSGGVSDAHVEDAQAGADAAAGLFAAVTGGVNHIQGAGGLSSSLTTSYGKLVADSELFGYLRRFADGVDVDANALALETIRETGVLGTYLNKRHTLTNLKAGALWMPDLLVRDARERWQNLGAKELRDSARARAEHLLRTHQPEPLTTEVERELQGIMREIESRELGR
ncbi:MAG: hypothetical protein GX605_06675 [Chloroflexi bacterium]|nr:hypothetical protein [Chloroflexota bacterium]